MRCGFGPRRIIDLRFSSTCVSLQSTRELTLGSSGCRVATHCVRGVFSVKGPDCSFGGVPVGYCPDVDHMEEEVQVTVQVEEGIGETHGKEQSEEQRVNERTTAQRG